MFHSNWVDSSSLIVKSHRGDLFSLSLTLSLSLSLTLSPQSLNSSCFFAPTFSQDFFLIFFKYIFFFFSFFFILLTSSVSVPLVQSDLSVGEWQQDGNSGNTSRVLSYTIALNNPLGPKTAPVVETQVSLR